LKNTTDLKQIDVISRNLPQGIDATKIIFEKRVSILFET
jgi:hypothetical protein